MTGRNNKLNISPFSNNYSIRYARIFVNFWHAIIAPSLLKFGESPFLHVIAPAIKDNLWTLLVKYAPAALHDCYIDLDVMLIIIKGMHKL